MEKLFSKQNEKDMVKGIYVGRFTEEQVFRNEDQKAVAEKKAETGLKYTNTRLVRKGKKIVGLDIWVCSLEDSENDYSKFK